MSHTPPPPVSGGEADEDILSISQDEFASAPAPATHPQVLDDVFTPQPFLLARDVRREVTDLAPHVPAPPQAAPAAQEVWTAEAVVAVAPVPAGLQAEAAQAAPAELYDRRAPVRATAEASPAAEPAEAEAAEDDGRDDASRPEAQAAPARPAPQPDNYAVGMRLLRISPAWLVLSSLGFFLLIYLLSWLYQPATQPETVASAAVQNHSANDRPAVTAVPEAATAVAPVAKNPEPAQPPAAQPAQAQQAAQLAAAQPAPAAQPAAAGQPSAQAAPAGRFAVQVGSYNNPSEANERVSKLRASGFEARAAAVEIPQRGTWHRVYVGGFATREEAARHAGELRSKGAAPAGLVVEVK